MKELNLKSIRKRSKPTKDKIKIQNFAPFDLVKQNFTQTEPNKVWCGDVTQVNINKNKFYICVIYDTEIDKRKQKGRAKLSLQSTDRTLKVRSFI